MALTDKERTRLEAERDDLTRKADKRRNEPGFARNVEEMDARLAEITEALAAE